MPKYLCKAAYNADGAKGLLKEGGTARRAAVQKIVEGVGGKLESFYYAFGEDDVYTILDLPDTATAVALSLVINASGAVKISATPLISPEEIDAAAKKNISYRAPGQ